jgi:GTP-binding protein HflX
MSIEEESDEREEADERDGVDERDESAPPRRAVLCSVQLQEVNEQAFEESLEELRRLGQTLGLTIDGRVTQRRSSFDSAAYVGPGKLADLTTQVKLRNEATVVLLDHEVSPSQARNIKKATGAQAVLDRTALILEIFHRHARSRQAKAQVELVRLQYMAPRLRETEKSFDRQRGGIGGKGAGESAMELDRRKLRDRIAELRDELEALEKEHKTRSARRQGLRRVALCGYTNAGKSTLFHALTDSDVYIADKLFATLDTTVRALGGEPPPRQRILVSDTIGFIRHLPTKLVASFKTTLDEALEAGLILHIVDAADPACLRHIETTNSVLGEIGAGEVPLLYVFNKCDKLEGGELPKEVTDFIAQLEAKAEAGGGTRPLRISAKSTDDVSRVRQAIINFFDLELVEAELFVPHARGQLRGAIFAAAEVKEERSDETGTFFKVRLDAPTLARLARDVQVRVTSNEKASQEKE